MRIALIGQPNCGKSTLFNQVAGYRAETGNFSGTTVTFTESRVRVSGSVVELVDLPGTYTLAGTNEAERVVFDYLSAHSVDVIINVVDASHLHHNLELTIELLELNCPVVLALNMMDEARRMGIDINIPELSDILGVPVIPIIASKGVGMKRLFLSTVTAGETQDPPHRLPFSRELEYIISHLSQELGDFGKPLNPEVVAIKLLEGEEDYIYRLAAEQSELLKKVEDYQARLEKLRGTPPVWIIGGERHARAASIAESVITVGEQHITWQDRLDDFLLHPVWGYFFLILILFLFFQVVYFVGSLLEGPLLSAFEILENQLYAIFGNENFWGVMLVGLIQGISGGLAIVLPYLVPFLGGLGILEDVGYLPRVAFLMDALMHRLGLHGKAIVPFILGYGCNVPAIMSTRIMEERRDRFLSAALATLVPCAARMSVIFGLVAFYIGPNLALAIYIFNLLVIALTAQLLSRMLPEDSPGLILEMPVYRIPTVKTVFNKAWFRIREFIIEAWPVLILGSIALSILNFLNWDIFFNMIFRPISWVLGLPQQVGVPLIFGVLRKELSLVMLRQALGGGDLGAALTSVQMITFSVFVMFYIPCLGTLAVLKRELGTKAMLLISVLTVIIALLAALVSRGVAVIFLG